MSYTIYGITNMGEGRQERWVLCTCDTLSEAVAAAEDYANDAPENAAGVRVEGPDLRAVRIINLYRPDEDDG